MHAPLAGTIKPGYSKMGSNDTLDIVSAFQSYGGFTAGLINEDERCDIVRNSCPGPGACGRHPQCVVAPLGLHGLLSGVDACVFA